MRAAAGKLLLILAVYQGRRWSVEFGPTMALASRLLPGSHATDRIYATFALAHGQWDRLKEIKSLSSGESARQVHQLLKDRAPGRSLTDLTRCSLLKSPEVKAIAQSPVAAEDRLARLTLRPTAGGYYGREAIPEIFCRLTRSIVYGRVAGANVDHLERRLERFRTFVEDPKRMRLLHFATPLQTGGVRL